MENAVLQNIQITQGTIISMVVTAVLLFLLPIAYFIVWKVHCKKAVSLAPLFIGAAGFFVTVRILELGVHMVCIVLDNPISRFINGNTPIFVIYGIMMAGIFEECGRYVIIRYLMKKNKTRENMVMYGIGHGGIEVWAISLMAIVSYLSIAITIQTLGMEGALQALGVTEELADGIVPTITSVADFGAMNALWNVLERVSCMFIHIALTIIVAYAVRKGQLKYLLLAIFAHAAADFFPCISQRGIGALWMVEAWLFIWAVLLTVWGRKLYKEM